MTKTTLFFFFLLRAVTHLLHASHFSRRNVVLHHGLPVFPRISRNGKRAKFLIGNIFLLTNFTGKNNSNLITHFFGKDTCLP